MQLKKIAGLALILACLLPRVAFGQASYVEAEYPRIHGTKAISITTDGAYPIYLFNNVSTTATGFYIDGTTGNLTSQGGATISAVVTIGADSPFTSILGTADVSLVGLSTADAADSKTLVLTAGNAAVTDGSRGGTMYLRGNEVATTGGSITMLSGNAATAQLTLAIEHASSNIIFKDITSGNLWTISDAGELTQAAGTLNLKNNSYLLIRNAADGANLSVLKADATDNPVLNAGTGKAVKLAVNSTDEVVVTDDTLKFGVVTGGTPLIATSSVDAADDNTLVITAGSVVAADGSRGATIYLRGNEFSGSGGSLNLFAGNKSTANLNLFIEDPNSAINFRDLTTGIVLTVEDDGDLVQEATNGGNIIMSKAGKGILLGSTSAHGDITALSTAQPHLYVSDSSVVEDQVAIIQHAASTAGALFRFYKTRSTADDADTIVVSGDTIATIGFNASDGAAYRQAASIRAIIDGTPGSNDMPGALIFATKADNTASTTDQLKIGLDGLAAFTGQITSAATSALGWAVIDPTDNIACNTSCTFACVFGIANATGSAVTGIVACTDATADLCLCAGAS